MTENESVDLDLSAMTASLQVAKSSFTHVTFRDTAETYTVGKDVVCTYILSTALEPTSRDWIGLYKVGWRSPENYVCYEWSPMPKNYVAGTEVENRVVFPAAKLPNDDGEFYQFCYVTSKANIRGASPPFQFRKSVSFSSSLDDLIEIEDENGELLIVRSKTAFLDEQLKKSNDKNAQLRQDVQLLQNEKEMLLLGKKDVEKRLQRQKDEDIVLRQQIEESNSVISQLSEEIKSLQATVAALQEKHLVTVQEKSELQSRILEMDSNLAELRETKKSLMTEHDTLLGHVKSLESEKALYQTHYTSSESTLQVHVQKNEELRQQLSEEQGKCQRLVEQIEVVQKELAETREQLDGHLLEMERDKEQIRVLNCQLGDTKAEVLAREKQVQASEEQLSAFLEACQKLSTDLEVTKTESEGLKIQLQNLKVGHELEKEKLARELEQMVLKLDAETKEKESLATEMSKLHQQLDEVASLAGTDSALYAIQTAYSVLKERYFRMEKQVAKQRATVDQAMMHRQELEQEIANQKHEITSLKERLVIGQEAFKEKFIECQKLQECLAKQQIACVPAAVPREGGHPGGATGVSCADSLTITELQQQMKDVNAELERRADLLRHSEQRVLQETHSRTAAERRIAELEAELGNVRNLLSGSAEARIHQTRPVSLPPPMIPQRLHTAVVPSIASSALQPPVAGFDAVDSAGSHTSSSSVGIERPPLSIDEVRSCVVCNLLFPGEMPMQARLSHIDLHFTEEKCPLCPMKCNLLDLQQHVQLHYRTE
jgi:chromosome segregation ATPase